MQNRQIQAFVFTTLGERLRFLRAVHGLSVRTVSERTKNSISSIYAWESNRRVPKLHNLNKLSVVYDAPINWLKGDYSPYIEEPIFISVENSVGERVRFVRQLEGLSIEDAAQQLGVSVIELTITEAGFEPKLPYTQTPSFKMCESFDTSYDFILHPSSMPHRTLQIEGRRVKRYRAGRLLSPEEFAQATGVSVAVLHGIEEGRFPLTNRLREKFANYLELKANFFHINTRLASDAVDQIGDPLDRMVAKILLDIYEFHSKVENYSPILSLSLRDEMEREIKNGSADETTLAEIKKRHLEALQMCELVLKHVRSQDENRRGVDFTDMLTCYQQIRNGDLLLEEWD